MHVTGKIPGGATGLYAAHIIALLLLLMSAGLLARKMTQGLLVFVLGTVAYMDSNDIPYAEGGFLFLIVLAVFAFFAYRKESRASDKMTKLMASRRRRG
jgi:hypothetical protein